MCAAAVLILAAIVLPFQHTQARSIELANGGVITVGDSSQRLSENVGGIVVGVIGLACLATALMRTRWTVVPGVLNLLLWLALMVDHNSGGGPKSEWGLGFYVYAVGTVVYGFLSFGLWKKPATAPGPAQ